LLLTPVKDVIEKALLLKTFIEAMIFSFIDER